MLVLGIETSCDETGIAVYSDTQGLLSNALYSQVAEHAPYGGVVPELASRNHVEKLTPLLRQALREANCDLNDIDVIGYTHGPGLVGALLCGATFACSLAYALQKPCYPINHLKAHIMAACLDEATAPTYPFLALLVSGGHTQLLQVDDFQSMTLLGETLDDAAGECFDKSAKVMGLGYPGGAVISRLAQQGDPQRFPLTVPMVNQPGLEMSFSGLKTQVRQTWLKTDQSQSARCDLAAALEQTIARALAIKCERAIRDTKLTTLVIAGGVSANRHLRQTLSTLVEQHQGLLYCPPLALCTDNGGMVAYTTYLQHCHAPVKCLLTQVSVDPRATL